MKDASRVELPDEVRAQLVESALRLGSPYDDLEGFLLSVYRIFARLPVGLLAPLRAFASDPTAPGFLVVENGPVDPDIPTTPTDGRRSPRKKTYVSEAGVLGLAQLLGEPLGYHNEKEGEVVQSLSPVATEASRTSSESCDISLGFHTDFDFDESDPDHAYNVTNADFIVLICLRSDPAGEASTLYADARDICAELTAAQQEVLRQPLFQFGASFSFTGKSGDDRIWSVPTPVLKGPERFPEISIDMLCGARGIDAEAESTLQVVAEACASERVVQSVCLRPGQLLLINNRKGAHARMKFRAAYDGTDRWLQRVYARRSLWELRKHVGHGPRVF